MAIFEAFGWDSAGFSGSVLGFLTGAGCSAGSARNVARKKRGVKVISKLGNSSLAQLLTASAVAAVFILGGRHLLDRWLDYFPAETWMKIEEVSVPDHKAGEDPKIFYNRLVTSGTEFRADWHVEARRADDITSTLDVCRGDGQSTYSPGEGPIPYKLSYYMNAKCNLAPGCYRLHTSWFVIYGNWRAKRPITNMSNKFCVSP